MIVLLIAFSVVMITVVGITGAWRGRRRNQGKGSLSFICAIVELL